MLNKSLLNSCNKLLEEGAISKEQQIKCQQLLDEPNEDWSKNSSEVNEFDELIDKINNGKITNYKEEIDKIKGGSDMKFSYEEVDKKLKEIKKLEKELNKNKDKSMFIVKKKLIADKKLSEAKYQLIIYVILMIMLILIIIYYNIWK